METFPHTASKSDAISFGDDVFGPSAMVRYLSQPVVEALMNTVKKGVPLSPAMADEVANGMKSWALEKGATHFTHWFQPLTGAVAEKHDSFLAVGANGEGIARFSGRDLIQGEPDASSFPSGGLRATFEARGYTAWDPTSHAFVVNAGTPRAVLCIPCVFCGYRGEALDVKAPLLRSREALAKQLERVGELFEVEKKIRPYATLGVEQEYFLIDKEFLRRRPDLVMCGRTLFGRRPARHQQMEDHYFGRVPSRVLAFMADVDSRLWRLGVPAKTRHNEVSPAQFELAPIFEEQNLAVDHNLLTMHVLQDTAEEHGFVCLLHEKPFAGVNGSGKHNNWSLVGPDGKNWFAPGATPHDNAKFLFMLVAVLKAVDAHAALIRASVATAGNDHRLGANEAPPAIMSVYLGDQLEDIVNQIEAGGVVSSKSGGVIEIGVSSLPVIPRDVSDRNRTSPFAFTGNKFEFRAVGASQSCGDPQMILNLTMAWALDEMTGALERRLAGSARVRDARGHSREFHAALQQILQTEVRAHKRMVFGGDGYADAWREEAARRGLPNLRTAPEALGAWINPGSIELFEKYGVLSEREARSRHDAYLHAWEQTVLMDGGCALDLARTFIMPAVMEAERRLAEALEIAERHGRRDDCRRQAYETVAALSENFHVCLGTLEQSLGQGGAGTVAALAGLRVAADNLETLTPDAVWPFPCYGEMFFRF